MSRDGLQLTVHLGERDRAGDGFLADALIDACARHGVQASCLLRGIEGFGAHHRLATERLLTLSEDLPLACVAVDEPARIEALADEARALQRGGLVTVEDALLLGAGVPADEHGADAAEAKLTVFLGRRQRTADGDRPAHLAVVDALHDAGVAGASVLLGVDGTAHGRRRRARFAGSNAHVPLIVVSVGARNSIAAALPKLTTLLGSTPVATLQPVQVCKRDGARLSAPPADDDTTGWRKLTVYASEQSRHRGATLHDALLRRLRAEGAAGATALRGIWGYHGDHAPHGDRFWSLRRRVPVITVVIDEPQASRRWFETIDELTDETGLVTSERVLASSAGPADAPHPTPRR